jgi:hypothetical protein
LRAERIYAAQRLLKIATGERRIGASVAVRRKPQETLEMGKGILLWLLGIPIPVIILLFAFHIIH